jgi:DNA-binding NarL/FixJ family response regulator
MTERNTRSGRGSGVVTRNDPKQFSVIAASDRPLLASLLRRVIELEFEFPVMLHSEEIQNDDPVQQSQKAEVFVKAGSGDMVFEPKGNGSTVVISRLQPSDTELFRWISCGAVGIISEQASLLETRQAIEKASANHSTLNEKTIDQLCAVLRSRGAEAARPISLSAREIDLLRSIDSGQSVKQTARSLGIAIKTVENTQRLLFRKLGVRNRAQAIARSNELGLLRAYTEAVSGVVA